METDIQAQIAKQEENLSRAKQENDQEALALTWEKLGCLYSEQRNYPQSLDCYQQAAALASQLKDFNILFHVGLSLHILHEEQQSIDCLKQSIQIALNHEGNEGHVMRVLLVLGNMYKDFLDGIPQAIAYYKQGLEFAQKLNRVKQQQWYLPNLGRCYTELGDIQQALHYYEQGLTLARQDNDQATEANLLAAIAKIFAKAGDQTQMTAYFQQALSAAQASDNLDGNVSVLIWWGDSYRDSGEPLKVLDYYQQALALAQNHGVTTAEGRCLNIIAGYHSHLKNWPQAIEIYQQILRLTTTDAPDKISDIAQKHQLSYYQTVALGSLGEIYEEIGDIPQALDYLEQTLASTTLPTTVWKLNNHIARLKQNLISNETHKP